jgi:hypothetical protein
MSIKKNHSKGYMPGYMVSDAYENTLKASRIWYLQKIDKLPEDAAREGLLFAFNDGFAAGYHHKSFEEAAVSQNLVRALSQYRDSLPKTRMILEENFGTVYRDSFKMGCDAYSVISDALKGLGVH